MSWKESRSNKSKRKHGKKWWNFAWMIKSTTNDFTVFVIHVSVCKKGSPNLHASPVPQTRPEADASEPFFKVVSWIRIQYQEGGSKLVNIWEVWRNYGKSFSFVLHKITGGQSNPKLSLWREANILKSDEYITKKRKKALKSYIKFRGRDLRTSKGQKMVEWSCEYEMNKGRQRYHY